MNSVESTPPRDERLRKSIMCYRDDDVEVSLYPEHVTWQNIANPQQSRTSERERGEF